MNIRKTTLNDLPAVMELYCGAQARMAAADNPQWPTGWPSEEKVREDIFLGNSYVLETGPDEAKAGFDLTAESGGTATETDDETSLVGVFAFVLGDEPTYAVIEDGDWLNDEPYGTLHRVASNGKVRGVMQAALEFCEQLCPNVRVDTHATNAAMQHILEKNGYQYCGVIYVEDGTPHTAEKKLVKAGEAAVWVALTSIF